MTEFIQNILRRIIQAQLGSSPESVSRYQVAKAIYLITLSFRQGLIDTLMVFTGVLMAGLGLKSFLLPNQFIDGGVTGISLLVSVTMGLPLSVLIVLINLPFVLLAYRQISPSFALKSIMAVATLALVIVFVPYPIITSDKLLIASFGGFFLGTGIGLAIRGGAVLDGTEVLAIYLSRKSSFSVGDIILIFNLMIFSVAAYLLGFETAMYAILTYLAASKTVDFIIEGVEEYVGVTIISSHHEEIRQFIVHKLQVGVTTYTGSSGHGKRGKNYPTEILFTVITRLEIGKLQHEVEKIDSNAFIVIGNVRGIKGGSTRQRAVDKH
ncbi:MAG: YitT family protein [Saprospiraceae bacterium]|nr:YitT family protein [Saprospiraceae bacterium]